jgi:hypothetical protein
MVFGISSDTSPVSTTTGWVSLDYEYKIYVAFLNTHTRSALSQKVPNRGKGRMRITSSLEHAHDTRTASSLHKVFRKSSRLSIAKVYKKDGEV